MDADFLGMRPAEFYRLRHGEVERELERRFPQYIDDEKLLDIYTKWLVFQIPNLDYRSHLHSSETIRRGCDYLSSRNYNKGLVISAFSRHKGFFLKDRPENRRAFNLARRDVEISYEAPPRLLSKSDPSPNSTSRSLKTAANSTRSALSRDQSTMGTPATRSPEKPQPDLDALSPSNRKKMFHRLNAVKPTDSSSVKITKKTSVPTSPEIQLPPASYICKRCGIPGDLTKSCSRESSAC
ncbi:uncharacterized protein ColSpa_08819 [Colletotrichum spaethianum]|uniref:CCHC-type domain-containing protein n=1 Tax=Colletotrichum spaethianum TaxID=700344 RepID=A0AA37PAF1_9PEZI|nr:uncharacterized protein ColSpa_08819 [Colletotrichum spaethianum]GKT48638.1 hypothetical protein ColSpa_08819 [Colletotrichum spaethianum]